MPGLATPLIHEGASRPRIPWPRSPPCLRLQRRSWWQSEGHTGKLSPNIAPPPTYSASVSLGWRPCRKDPICPGCVRMVLK
jgi:hypothetical protein